MKSWDIPVDTLTPRRALLDLALVHLQIATRNEDGNEQTPEARAETDHPSRSLKGDYAEFGVFRGDTFVHVCKRAAALMPQMKFYAFDSFEGLPRLQGLDVGAEFSEGQFSCSQSEFSARLASDAVDMSRVVIVPGWFDDTIGSETNHPALKTVSLAYIDCDLYQSTIPVLKFLTPRLVQGSILLFDDWFHFRADPAKGVQRAVAEWLERTPNVSLVVWQPFSHHGLSFFVNRRM